MEEIAQTITIANAMLFTIPIEELKNAASQLRQQAQRYDSMAALNRLYNPEQGRLTDLQAKALELLIEYIETNKKIDGQATKVKSIESAHDNIQNLFR